MYAYAKLLRLKLTVRDAFAVPLFAAFSAAMHIVKIYIKLFVPIALLIFGIAYVYLRFRKPFYETVTVSTIVLGITIVMFVLGMFLDVPVAMDLFFLKTTTLKNIVTQFTISSIQLIGVFLLFKIKRFQSGIEPKGEAATFEILLYCSEACIFTMMLFYTTQPLYHIILLVLTVCGLLLILWWRRHITYNYREAVKRRNVEYLEEKIAEYEVNSAAGNLQLAVYSRQFHYLNKAIPACAYLAERAAADTGDKNACGVYDLLQKIMSEMNIANEKCSFENIPQTGVKAVDASIYKLYAAAENRRLKVSAVISADVGAWFGEENIDKHDIHILLDYLCDNAVISACGSFDARVRLELGATQENKPRILVYDSGKQFDAEVIAKLGKERVTARAGVGGSGIGLFTVFEIAAKYGASFLLDEGQSFGFTKCIEIAFDGKGLFTVRTPRRCVAAACSERGDIIIEKTDEEILRDGTDG